MTHTRLQPQRSSSLKSSPWNDVWLSLRPPGAPLGLHVLEVRDTSLVVLWDAPAFSGRSPVIGYYLDIKEAAGGDGAWRAVHEKVHQIKYMKVTDAWGRKGDARDAVTERDPFGKRDVFVLFAGFSQCLNVKP